MASSVSGCRHTPGHPLRGTRKVGVDADPNLLVFACDACGQRFRVARCAATSAKSGTRCRAAAVPGRQTCRVHVFAYCPDCRNQAPADLCGWRSPLRLCPVTAEPHAARCGMQTCWEHDDFECRARKHAGVR